MRHRPFNLIWPARAAKPADKTSNWGLSHISSIGFDDDAGHVGSVDNRAAYSSPSPAPEWTCPMGRTAWALEVSGGLDSRRSRQRPEDPSCFGLDIGK